MERKAVTDEGDIQLLTTQATPQKPPRQLAVLLCGPGVSFQEVLASNKTEEEHGFSSQTFSSFILTNDIRTREVTGQWYPTGSLGCRLTGTLTTQPTPI